jgi:predicted component of type VI protein secretion system
LTFGNGRYRVDYAKMPGALAALGKELLEQEATGNRARTEAWFAKYDRMPQALTDVLAGAADVPIDVDPVFSFAEPVR